jgi:hypothetical protein
VIKFAKKNHLSEGQFLIEFREVYDQYQPIRPIIFRCTLPGTNPDDAKTGTDKVFEKEYSVEYCERILGFLLSTGSFAVKKTIEPESLTMFYLPTEIFNSHYHN